MSAEELVRYLADAGFLGLFVLTLVGAVRQPSRARLDTSLFFGALALVIAIALTLEAIGGEEPELVVACEAALIMALPYLLLRLARDFAGVSPFMLRVTGVALAGVVVSLFLVEQPYPAGHTLPLVAFFVVVEVYAATRFISGARATSGVTRRRMQAVALGSLLLGLVILVAGFGVVFPDIEGVWTSLTSALVLASGVSYYLGFATPGVLRRAWRADDLRRFMDMSTAVQLVTDGDEPFPRAVAASIESSVARVVGAPRALVILWDEASERLLTMRPTDEGVRAADRESTVAYRVFREQRAYFVEDAARDDPANAEAYRAIGANALLTAPITSGDRRLGVLTAFGQQPSLFVDDDLRLLRALASQVATLIVARELLVRTARVRGREEANRLKEEFLSAAAHDLKTPLTTLLGQAQLMQRRTRRDPERVADSKGIDRMVDEAQRMRRLVEDLLDASRSEQGSFVGERAPMDLHELACEVVEATSAPDHQLVVTGERVIASVDRDRMRQVVQNLLDNAVKYSPEGGDVQLTVAPAGAEVLLTVSDGGIGIPREDLPVIFERFHRGSRANDRRFTGMGVGLYLCKRIVEEHGGRIWAESIEGQGSQLYVALPRSVPEGKLHGEAHPRDRR